MVKEQFPTVTKSWINRIRRPNKKRIVEYTRMKQRSSVISSRLYSLSCIISQSTSGTSTTIYKRRQPKTSLFVVKNKLGRSIPGSLNPITVHYNQSLVLSLLQLQMTPLAQQIKPEKNVAKNLQNMSGEKLMQS